MRLAPFRRRPLAMAVALACHIIGNNYRSRHV